MDKKRGNRAEKLLGAVTCIAILLVLPSTMSRASWLAAIAGCAVVVSAHYIPELSLKTYYVKHKKTA